MLFWQLNVLYSNNASDWNFRLNELTDLEDFKSRRKLFQVLGRVTFGNESKNLQNVFSSLKLWVLLGLDKGVNISLKDTGKMLFLYLYKKIPVLSLKRSSAFKIFNLAKIGSVWATLDFPATRRTDLFCKVLIFLHPWS